MDKVPTLNLKPDSSRTTFRRKGATYIINNIHNDNDTDYDVHIIDDFYEDVVKMSRVANFTATIYKFLHVLSSIFIIVGGLLVGFLQIIGHTQTNVTSTLPTHYTSYDLAIIIIGFALAVLRALLSLFLIEKKSYMLKESAIKLKKYARDIKSLKTMELTNVELFRRLDEIHTKVDDLDVYMFNGGGSTESKINDTNNVKVTV